GPERKDHEILGVPTQVWIPGRRSRVQPRGSLLRPTAMLLDTLVASPWAKRAREAGPMQVAPRFEIRATSLLRSCSLFSSSPAGSTDSNRQLLTTCSRRTESSAPRTDRDGSTSTMTSAALAVKGEVLGRRRLAAV